MPRAACLLHAALGEGPFRNGLRLGAVCLGCCWALMLLAFVGGVMNLAFMGLATLVMALEKLTWIGADHPAAGGLLIAGGLLTLARPFLTEDRPWP
jgi:predicted metal-binding membrane protein